MTDIPFDEKEFFPDDCEYFCPPASGTDMTGLIPFSAESGQDTESYSELYPFLADGLPEKGREMRQERDR